MQSEKESLRSERLRRKIRALRDGDEPVTPSASDIESDASASDWGGNSESESESETAYTLQRTRGAAAESVAWAYGHE